MMTRDGGRSYRLGRSAAKVMALAGWLVMAGGAVIVLIGLFQMIALEVRGILTLGPWLGGGGLIFFNGLGMVAGGELMLAMFEIARNTRTGRSMIAGARAEPALVQTPDPVPQPAPVPMPAAKSDPRGRVEPSLRRVAGGEPPPALFTRQRGEPE